VRRKRSSFRRLRPFWIVGVVVAGLAGWGGVELANLPALQMKSLDVTGVARVTRAEVVARAAIDPHANVWLLDTRAIAERIEAIPYVATARVHRRPPAKVWIEITERTPDACVRDASARELTIDAALRVVETGCVRGDLVVFALRSRLAATPGAFITDSELGELESDSRALETAFGHFVSFTHDSYGGLNATLGDGVVVKFGDDGDLPGKSRLIGPILAELGPRATSVWAVDLRAEATPVVEFRPPRPVHPHPLDKL
jgi:cell division protein FtsQ